MRRPSRSCGNKLGDALVEQVIEVDRAVLQVSLGQAQRHAQRHEPLLRPVVEVAPQASPLVVAGMQQPCPARLDVEHRTTQLQPEPDHLDEQRRGIRDLARQRTWARLRMGQHTDRLVAEQHRGHLSPAVEHQRFAGRVLEAVLSRHPIPHLQARVMQGGPQCILELFRSRLAEVRATTQFVDRVQGSGPNGVQPPVHAPAQSIPEWDQGDGAHCRGSGRRRR